MKSLGILLLCCLLWRPVTAGEDDSPAAKRLLAEANSRIERLRKADAKIVVVDRKGKPIAGAKVKVEQLRHRFLFGCAALSLLNHSDPKQEAIYQKQFGDLFNFATILTFWQDTDPEPERQTLDKLIAQAERLKAMGIQVKGHPLILAGAIPKWVPNDAKIARELTRKRIRNLVHRVAGLVDVWDVVGDATTAGGVQNGLGAWARQAGAVSMTADALKWARNSNPKALLMYNDYKLDSDYLTLIRDMVKTGAPLDALGLEAHMGATNWTMEKIWETAETFQKLGKPLHFSEITVLSDDPTTDHSKEWSSTPEGEQRQAEYVEKLYTLLFSHPAVEAIAWWNFVDGDWDRNPGGLLRRDLTLKPAYMRLHNLIRKKWWTQADIETNSHGIVTLRGFAGRYRVTVQTAKGKSTIETDLLLGKPNVFRVQAQ